MDWEYNMNMSE